MGRDASVPPRGCLILVGPKLRLRNEPRPVVSQFPKLLPAVMVLLSCFWLGFAASFSQTLAASLRIAGDEGGNIGQYWARYMAVRDSGEQVVIDGTCSSACTMVLGIVPHNRICVTPNAMLGFHAAWRPGFLGIPVINVPATQTLWNLYPNPIRQWIARNGGLGPHVMYLSGPELLAMYRECR